MGYADAARMQAGLLDKWIGPIGRGIIAEHVKITGDPFKTTWAKVVSEVAAASPVWVSKDICALLGHSARSWPGEFTLKEHDVPLQKGFVVFEEPLWLPLRHFRDEQEPPRVAHLKCVAWVFGKGWELGPEDSELSKQLKGHSAISYTFYDHSGPDALGVFHSCGWVCGDAEDWTPRMHDPMVLGEYTIPRVKLSQVYLMSFLRFISSKVLTAQTQEVINRGARRSLERSNLKRSPAVHVVKLRRVEGKKPSGQHTTVNWSKKWPVSGHWRDQLYASTGEHRPIWIDEYVKLRDRDDLPLVVPTPKKVYEVTR